MRKKQGEGNPSKHVYPPLELFKWIFDFAPWSFQGAKVKSPWSFQGGKVKSPWSFQGGKVKSPWTFQGAKVKSPWSFQGAKVKSPWTFQGAKVKSPWTFSRGGTCLDGLGEGGNLKMLGTDFEKKYILAHKMRSWKEDNIVP